MAEHKVVEIRATGRTPEVVTNEIQTQLNEHQEDGWELITVQPLIFNSQATGYILLFLSKS